MKIPHYFVILVICLVSEISEGKFNCETPTLKNGKVRIRSNGRVARFRCRKKFKLYGAKIALCINDEWNLTPPTCVASGRKCPKLKPSKDLIVSKELRDGVWKLSCPSGLQLRGRDFIYCGGSQWSDELPTCVSTETTRISTSITPTGSLNESYTTLASNTDKSLNTRSTLLTSSPSTEAAETTSTTTDNKKGRTTTGLPTSEISQTNSSVYIYTTPEEVLQTTRSSHPRDRLKETTIPRSREQTSETTTTLKTSSATLLSTKISRKSTETTTLQPEPTTLKPEMKTQNSKTTQITTSESTTTGPDIIPSSTEPLTEKQTTSSALPRKTTTILPNTTYNPTRLTTTSPSSTSMKITTLVSTIKPLTSVTIHSPSTTPPVIPISSTSGLPTFTTTTVTSTTVAINTITTRKKPGLSTSAITTNPAQLSPENPNVPTNDETTSTVTIPSRRTASPSPNSPPSVFTSKSQIPKTTTTTTLTTKTTRSSDYFNNTINEEPITKPPTNETDIPNVISVAGQQSAPDDPPIQPLMIGLGVGVAIGLVIVIVGSYMWIRRRRRKEEECDEMAPITGRGSQEW